MFAIGLSYKIIKDFTMKNSMELKSVTIGQLIPEHVISGPNGPAGSGHKLIFSIYGSRENKILLNQYIIIESNSMDRCGFDTIKNVKLEIGGVIVETHSSQLLKDLTSNAHIDQYQCRIPLQFFYCRGYPLILDALMYHDVRVAVELNTFDYTITKMELESIIVTAEKIHAPVRIPVKIISEDYIGNYDDAIIGWNKVYYINSIFLNYENGQLRISG